MSAAERRRVVESCVSSTLCQLRQCAQASDWTRAAELVEDLDGCSGCAQFVAHRAAQDQQWDWVVRLFDQCSLQQRSELVTGLLAQGQWQAAEGPVQGQQWDLVLQLIERGVSAALRNSLLWSALDHRQVLCTAKLLDLGVSKPCREEGIGREIASGRGDFILEVVRNVRDPDLTDFVLRESLKQNQWSLVSGLMKEGLSVAQMESVCDQAVADQQWTVALQLLRDGVSASEWMVNELFQNNKAQDLLDLFPAGSVPEGLKGLLLMASIRHGMGDFTLHILKRETVSDSELMEAIKYAIHLLDKTIFLKLVRDCPRGCRVFKQKFIHQQWKEYLSPEDDGSDGGEVRWLYPTLYEEGEKDLALHVAASELNLINIYDFCRHEMDHFDFRKKRYRYALRKLHHKDYTRDYCEFVEELYKLHKTSKSDRSFLFCDALRREELDLAVDLCEHGVSKKDLKFATRSLLLEKADHEIFDNICLKLDREDSEWLKEYAAMMTMKVYFKQKTDSSLETFMERFKSCFDETRSSVFRKAVEKCVKYDFENLFAELCKTRFTMIWGGNLNVTQEEDCCFAYACAVDGKKFNFISKVCKEKFAKDCFFHLPEVNLLLDVVIERKAWDILLIVLSNLKVSRYHHFTELLNRCLYKMLSDQSTRVGFAPAVDLLIRNNFASVPRECADLLDQWPAGVPSLKQLCVDSGHAHLAFFLAVATDDWPMVETMVNTQTSLDLQDLLLEQLILLAAKKGAFSASAALLKLKASPFHLSNKAFFSELRLHSFQYPLTKACEKQGLLDWALLLQSNKASYVKKHHRDCHDPFVLNNVLREASRPRSRKKWVLVQELVPRCADASTFQCVLKAAVNDGEVDIAETLISRVDPSLVGVDDNSNKTLLFLAMRSTSFGKRIKMDLVRLFIVSGLSTFQRHIPFELNKRSGSHNCPMLCALGIDNLPIVKLMLACGALTHKRLDQIRQDRHMQRCLSRRSVEEVWKAGYRCMLEAAATPCRLVHMARCVASHCIGCRPGRSERIDSLRVPEPIKDLLRFKDVLAMDVSSEPQPTQDRPRDQDPEDMVYSDSDPFAIPSSSGSDDFDSEEDMWM